MTRPVMALVGGVRVAGNRIAGLPPTLLAVAHGTREAAGVATTEALVDRVRALRPDLRVERCFLDLVSPSLPEALAQLSGEVVLVPLLLGAGYHVRVDIPDALAEAPHLRARVARALGPDPLLAAALTDRLSEAGWPRDPGRPRADALVLAAAGSTDPAANADTAAMAELLQDRLRVAGAASPPPVVPAYLCAAGPTPAEAVAALRAAGHEQVAVASYLLGPGFFARRAAQAGACLTSSPIGPHDALARLVTLRYDEARNDRRRGPLRGRTGAHSGRTLTPGSSGARGPDPLMTARHTTPSRTNL